MLPTWTVNVEMAGGRRVYTVGGVNITDDVCHIRYQDSVDDAHGHGPLEAGRSILNAAATLGEYANTIAGQGLVPLSILEAPEQMSPTRRRCYATTGSRNGPRTPATRPSCPAA